MARTEGSEKNHLWVICEWVWLVRCGWFGVQYGEREVEEGAIDA